MTNDPAPSREGQGYGKLAVALILGVAGAASLGWQGAVVGIVVGLALGHWIDTRLSEGTRDPEGPVPQAVYEVDLEAQRLFAGEVAPAFAALVRALDRDPAAAEGSLWRFLRDGLGFDEGGVEAAAAALQTADQGSLREACERCAQALPRSEHRLLVTALYELARDLGAGAGPTRLAMRDAAEALGVSAEEEAALRAATFGAGNDHSQDYQILGLEEDASDADVRRAFHKLASRHHPDRVAHLGEKAMELATREFEHVRGAYERVRSVRGF